MHVVPRWATVEGRGLGAGGIVTCMHIGPGGAGHVGSRGATWGHVWARVGSRGVTARKETDELEEDRMAGHVLRVDHRSAGLPVTVRVV